MSDAVIETEGLTRYFGRKAAVEQLSLSVPRGGVFAFLGRNGSGKTTTIRILMGMLDATRGSARVLGHDSANLSPQVRSRIGYLAEGHHVYGWMRVQQCAEFQAAGYDHWNWEIFRAVIEHFGLDVKARARYLSRGERAGLCLALTLAPEPQLLILDDPALGLDPVARRSLLEAMVFVTRGEDRTILFSSHLLSDVERVADRIAIIDRGILRACCTVEDFRRRLGQWVLRFDSKVAKRPDLSQIAGLVNATSVDNEWHVTVANPDEQTESTLSQLGPTSLQKASLNLEDAVIHYLGERGRSSLLIQTVGGDT